MFRLWVIQLRHQLVFQPISDKILSKLFQGGNWCRPVLLLNIALVHAVKVYRIVTFYCLFVGAFANQLRQTSIRFVSPVRSSVCMERVDSNRMDFREMLNWGICLLIKSVDTLQLWLKSEKSNRRGTLRPTYIFCTASPLGHFTVSTLIYKKKKTWRVWYPLLRYGGNIPCQKQKNVVIYCKSVAKVLKYLKRKKSKRKRSIV
jgi:hypothetical protein